MDVDSAIRIMTPHLKGTRSCVQAGGWIGMWPARLAQVFDTVYTFEPYAPSYAKLREATKDLPNVKSANAALGDRQGFTGMRIEKPEEARGNFGAAYLHGEGSVSVMRIDDLCLQDCDLIYLDIEGMEYQALLGAARTIERCHPVIGFEKKHADRYGASVKKILAFLDGYREVGRQSLDIILA